MMNVYDGHIGTSLEVAAFESEDSSMSLRDWAALERKWQEQWKRYAVGHVCSNCGALVDVMNPSWRWTGNGYEHKCPGVDAQAGHFPAEKRVKGE